MSVRFSAPPCGADMSARHLPPVHLEGFAFWSSRLPSWEVARAVICGEQAAPQHPNSRPAPSLLAPTERRRAPDTVAVALEVAARACESAQRPAAELASVFASTHGDLAISDYMCSTLASTPALISPIKFHNSVHNAAAGYWSIGTRSYAPYTAISAFRYTFGVGLLEAAVQAACEQKPILYVAFDTESKGALATVAPSHGLLGVAMVISHEATRGARSLELQVSGNADAALPPTAAASPAFDCVADNALAPCFAFVEAVAAKRGGIVRLAISEHARLHVRLS